MIKPEPLQGDKERELQKVETTKKGGDSPGGFHLLTH